MLPHHPTLMLAVALTLTLAVARVLVLVLMAEMMLLRLPWLRLLMVLLCWALSFALELRLGEARVELAPCAACGLSGVIGRWHRHAVRHVFSRISTDGGLSLRHSQLAGCLLRAALRHPGDGTLRQRHGRT